MFGCHLSITGFSTMMVHSAILGYSHIMDHLSCVVFLLNMAIVFYLLPSPLVTNLFVRE